MRRLFLVHTLVMMIFAGQLAGQVIIETPPPHSVANPLIRLVATTPVTNIGIRAVRLEQVHDLQGPAQSITLYSGNTNRIDLIIDTSPFDGEQVHLVIETDSVDLPRDVYLPIFALSNPRFTQKFLAPDDILDIGERSVLYRVPDGAELAFFDGAPRKRIQGTNFNSHSGHITQAGALIIDSDQSLALELNGSTLLTHTNVTKAKVRGDFGILQASSSDAAILRNFLANTNIAIPTPFFSADLGSNGVVYLAGWKAPNDTNTILYRFDEGALTQIDHETRHVQGRIETDGTNVLWFSAPFDLDTNNFQVFLLTLEGRFHLSTNYFPLFHSWIYEPDGLAFVRNGWTAFPGLDSNRIHHVWWRTPAGSIVQATSFTTNTVAIFDMRPDGGFLALGVESGTFENHLFFVKPDSPPLDLGPRTHSTYRFLGNDLVAYSGNSAVSINLQDRILIRMTHPHLKSSGAFSCYVTASEPVIFAFQYSTDLQEWTDISTNLMATTRPIKFEVTAPPGFIRTRQ